MERAIEGWLLFGLLLCFFAVVAMWAVIGAVAFLMGLYKIAENAELADRYRALQANQSLDAPAVVGDFTITYRSGKKTLTVQVVGDTEADAVAEAMRMAIPFDKILGIVKN